MKTFLVIIALFFPFIPAGCSKEQIVDSTEKQQSISIDTVIEHSMKGWELYSQHSASKWNYFLLTGTNRTKSYEEVISSAIKAADIDQLKALLDKFPQGEDLMWIGTQWLKSCWSTDYKDLQVPPQEIVDEIKLYCSLKGLTLNIAQ